LKRLLLLAALLWASLPAFAHVGSPNVFVETDAGPYKLYVTMQPPKVIPGVAAIEVRTSGPDVSAIRIAPMPLTGEGADHPPTPDAMHRSAQDPQFFTGSLWLMDSGSWQVRFQVDGAAGHSVVSVPIPAVAMTTLKMTRSLGALLAFLGLLLIAGLIGITAAALREAQLPPGAQPDRRSRKRAAAATAVALIVLITAVGLGATWWNTEASSYAKKVYRPSMMRPTLGTTGMLDLALSTAPSDVRRKKLFRLDDFIPDHDHLMHLYAVRWPALDVVYHLHPERRAPGVFQLQLPAMPPGEYRLYADVVHATGFPETLTAQIEVPQNLPGRPLIGDDAMGAATPASTPVESSTEFRLPDGYRMQWDQPASLVANKAYEFRFRLLDKDGKPPSDMALYMGMTGHAAFIKQDGSVFAHVHPSGTASMAAMMIASEQNGTVMEMQPAPSDTVAFPYGFPNAGRYRIIVQMKHAATIETGIFDANVADR
jgi:hypothetical protein